jgi:dsRNA-specific ribonuclease
LGLFTKIKVTNKPKYLSIKKLFQITQYFGIKNINLECENRFQELAQEKIELHQLQIVVRKWSRSCKQFLMAALIGDKEYGQGHGSSKQLAEQEAAQDALAKMAKSRRYLIK